MKKLIVNIDLDGVCADLPTSIIANYNKSYYDEDPNKYPNLQLKHWTKYYLEDIIKQPNITNEILANTPNIFSDLSPLPDFTYYIKLLSQRPEFDLRFISQLPSLNPAKALQEKLLWLHKYVFDNTDLTPNSFVACFEKDWVTGDIMIEDKVSNLLKFQGTRILVDWPYNQLTRKEEDTHKIIRLDKNHAWKQIYVYLLYVFDLQRRMSPTRREHV